MVKNPSANQETRSNPWVRKIPWRRKWQPIPIFLPWKFHGQRRLVGCGPWGRKESTPLSFWILTEHINSSPSHFSSGLVLSLTFYSFKADNSFISLSYTGLRSLLVSRALFSALDLQGSPFPHQLLQGTGVEWVWMSALTAEFKGQSCCLNSLSQVNHHLVCFIW